MKKKIIKLIAKILKVDVFFEQRVEQYKMYDLKYERIQAQFKHQKDLPIDYIQMEIKLGLMNEIEKIGAITFEQVDERDHYYDNTLLTRAKMFVVLPQIIK